MSHARSSVRHLQSGQAAWIRFGVIALACGAGAWGVVEAVAAQPAATRQTTRAATTRAEDPADAVLDRLLPSNDAPVTSASKLESTQAPRETPLNPRTFAGAMDATTGSGEAAVAPDTPARRLIREGSYVVDRIGHVRQSSDGRGLEFVFTADGQVPAAAGDPPMVIVPNLNLMAVESAIRDEPNRRFRVTGQVTEYRGRNHLILEKVVVLR